MVDLANNSLMDACWWCLIPCTLDSSLSHGLQPTFTQGDPRFSAEFPEMMYPTSKFYSMCPQVWCISPHFPPKVIWFGHADAISSLSSIVPFSGDCPTCEQSVVVLSLHSQAGEWHHCCGSHELIMVSMPDQYLILHLQNFIAFHAGMRVSSEVDLIMGYHQMSGRLPSLLL